MWRSYLSITNSTYDNFCCVRSDKYPRYCCPESYVSQLCAVSHRSKVVPRGPSVYILRSMGQKDSHDHIVQYHHHPTALSFSIQMAVEPGPLWECSRSHLTFAATSVIGFKARPLVSFIRIAQTLLILSTPGSACSFYPRTFDSAPQPATPDTSSYRSSLNSRLRGQLSSMIFRLPRC